MIVINVIIVDVADMVSILPRITASFFLDRFVCVCGARTATAGAQYTVMRYATVCIFFRIYK